MWKYQNTDELYHTGVLGMKWGHRKANFAKNYKSTKKDYDKLSGQEFRNKYYLNKDKYAKRIKKYIGKEELNKTDIKNVKKINNIKKM